MGALVYVPVNIATQSETHTGQPEYIHWEMVGPHNDYTAAVCEVSDWATAIIADIRAIC
jgi:hypothetical protein